MEINEVKWPGWEVVRLIGNGSFGAVYEIRRDVFGTEEKAALKVITIPHNHDEIDELRSEGYDDQSITSRFRDYLGDIVREYSMMAKMKGHTNVVYCDDVRYIQHDDGFGWDVYIKMELLIPMMNCLQNLTTEDEIIKLGIDLANALVLCSDRNIVHRDIKPQNIFVSEDGNFKLGDFGIAKTAERTTSGTKIGTYKYMAPEVYNSQPYGAAADIYSLGLVLYWLLNEHRTPFLPLPPQTPTASVEEQARRRRFMGEQIPLPAHGSRELQQIVLKACAFSPANRYQNAAQLRKALTTLADARERGVQTPQAQTPVPHTMPAPQRAMPAPQRAMPAPQQAMPAPQQAPTARTVTVLQPQPVPTQPPTVIAPQPPTVIAPQPPVYRVVPGQQLTITSGGTAPQMTVSRPAPVPQNPTVYRVAPGQQVTITSNGAARQVMVSNPAPQPPKRQNAPAPKKVAPAPAPKPQPQAQKQLSQAQQHALAAAPKEESREQPQIALSPYEKPQAPVSAQPNASGARSFLQRLFSSGKPTDTRKSCIRLSLFAIFLGCFGVSAFVDRRPITGGVSAGLWVLAYAIFPPLAALTLPVWVIEIVFALKRLKAAKQ